MIPRHSSRRSRHHVDDVPGTSPLGRLVNPLHADLVGLSPLLVIAGGSETLLNDSEQRSDRAVAAGVEVELSTYSEQQHIFSFMAGGAAKEDTDIAEFGMWLRARFGPN
ncbi:alpha/beta hydrolase fold domain-containing protein (plasmid) [Rhodococcus sp. ZPP]|nr:alpha/beta hydrolase fold domain-containing protein [Rhodococcus sp. ZPP]